MEYVGVVECECGHRFITTKGKTQCSKCGERFFSVSRAYSFVGKERDKTITELKTKLLEYEEIIKKLIPKIEKEQKETLEELKKLVN